jgi:hypothetical protein
MTALLLGVPLGVIASLFAWWVVVHGISPRIEFAGRLSRLPGAEPLFRLKLRNSGWRSVIDCEVMAELRIRSLAPNLPGNTWLIIVPLRRDRFAYLPKGANRLLVFMPYHPDERVRRFIPDRSDGYSLDELFALRDVVRLRIVAFAYDSFSGSRRVFVSKDYEPTDLVTGPYAASSSLDIQPGASETEPEDADAV